jgi:quercetin dioxygenase-like cupin family protein
MPIVRHDSLPEETFPGGASYRTIVGDEAGSTPIRVGVQTSPPGYSTGIHAHPYMEVVTVLEGEGEAWIDGEGEAKPLRPGTTLILPPDTRHSFTNTGSTPLRTYGVHTSPTRIVRRDDAATETGRGQAR